jgi:hypothetical protein
MDAIRKYSTILWAVNLAALVALPYLGLYNLWLVAAGLTMLPLVLKVYRDEWRIGVLFVAALIGAVAAVLTSPSLAWDEALLVLGLFAVGYGVRFLDNKTQPAARKPPVSRPANEAVRAIHTSATIEGMVKAAEAIREVTEQQIKSAAEQSEVIRLTNHQVDEFLALAEQVSEQARDMTRTAQEAAGMSQRGQSALGQAINGMSQIRVQVSAVGQTIYKLAQLTRRIDEIITSVSEIATQSNLLALNASIEAARAGVHGRGFAIVAEEVRTLSQQSTLAAKQVRAILSEIQTAVRETIDATEIGMQEVDTGVTMTQEADSVMAQLATNVTASYQSIRRISEIIRQQSDGMETIAINIERIDHIMQQNIVSTNLIEQVSKNLLALSDNLQTVEYKQESERLPMI